MQYNGAVQISTIKRKASDMIEKRKKRVKHQMAAISYSFIPFVYSIMLVFCWIFPPFLVLSIKFFQLIPWFEFSHFFVESITLLGWTVNVESLFWQRDEEFLSVLWYWLNYFTWSETCHSDSPSWIWLLISAKNSTICRLVSRTIN